MSRPRLPALKKSVLALGLLVSLCISAAIRVTVTPAPSGPLPSQPFPGRPTTGSPVVPSPTVPSSTVPGPPTDPLYPQQWNLPQIHLPEAWAQKADAPVAVAVLDTGYVQSDELTGPGGVSREANGYDFVSDASRSGDGDGRDADASGVGPLAFHAEAVANLIAAARDGQGVVGVNPQARILHVRVAGTDGMIDPQDLADAMRWAAGLSVAGAPLNRTPVRILNLSLYADFVPLNGCDLRVNAAVRALTARGVLVVAGAANDGADAAGYTPAGCPNVLTVTAVDRAGQRPGYANWGRVVALAAPGGSPEDGLPLLSRGQLLLRDGTSFAAPQAAGVASLMLGVNPALTPARLIAMLRASASPFPGGRCDAQNVAHSCGAGILNADAALRLAVSSLKK